MRCRAQTNFLRWQEWSVQFERDSALPWKFRRLINNATESDVPAARHAYMVGVGVPRDSIKAYEWRLLAVAGGESRDYVATAASVTVTKRATA